MKPNVENNKRNKVFEKRFNELRGDLSQAEFADKIGLSRPSIGYYENGNRVPDISTLKRIAETCNVSADWLIGLSDMRAGNADDMAIEKRLGLSEDAIKTLERLNGVKKTTMDEYLDEVPSAVFEEDRTALAVTLSYKSGERIIRMLNRLLSTQRGSNTLLEQTHAEYVLYTLYEYFYLEAQSGADRSTKMAHIYTDLMEFGKTLEKGNEQ